MRKTMITIALCLFGTFGYANDTVATTALNDIENYIASIKQCDLELNYERQSIRVAMNDEDAEAAAKDFHKMMFDISYDDQDWQSDEALMEKYEKAYKADIERFKAADVKTVMCKYVFHDNVFSESLFLDNKLIYQNTVGINTKKQIDNLKEVLMGQEILPNEESTHTIKTHERWLNLHIFQWIKHFENPDEEIKNTEVIDENKVKITFGEDDAISIIAEKVIGDQFLPTVYEMVQGNTKTTFLFNDYNLVENLAFPSHVKMEKERLDGKVYHYANQMVYIRN